MPRSPLVRWSIHLLRAKPCIGSPASARRTRRSSVPCRRSFDSPAILPPPGGGYKIHSLDWIVKSRVACESARGRPRGGLTRRTLRPPDDPHLTALPASAVEPIAAVGLEPRHTDARRHLEPLEDLARLRIDSPDIAVVTFPGAVPELSVDPCDAGDETVGLDGAKDLACLGIDLMDLPASIVPHPERALGPRKPRVAAAAGRRDRRQHSAGLRIDLLNAILGELKEVLAVEGRAPVRGHIDRALHPSARRIDGVQLVARREPDLVTVVRDAMDLLGARKGPVLADDLGG